MLKRIFGVGVCAMVLTLFAMPGANAAFTWFGFRNENTEVMINSTSEPHQHCWFNCPHQKPKPKHHHKHHPPKKGPKHHNWWWKK